MPRFIDYKFNEMSDEDLREEIKDTPLGSTGGLPHGRTNQLMGEAIKRGFFKSSTVDLENVEIDKNVILTNTGVSLMLNIEDNRVRE